MKLMKLQMVFWFILFSFRLTCIESSMQLYHHYNMDVKKIEGFGHKVLTEYNLLAVFTMIKEVKRNNHDAQNQDYSAQEQCVDEVLTIIIGMYKKIMNTTIAYYLLNCIDKETLHEKIAKIIVQDCEKIIEIFGKHCMHVLTQSSLTWQEKLEYCCVALGLIISIKFMLDSCITLPQIEKENQTIQKKEDGESGYIKDKFSNWRNFLSNTR